MSDLTTTGGGRGSYTVIPDNVFYVDAVNGSDENSGLLDSPWQTSAKVNSYTTFPTDSQICFNGGDTFDPILLSQSGTSGHPITLKSYGTGKAIIDASATAAKAFDVNGQSYIKLENLDLRGGTDATLMINTAGVTVQDCNIQGNNSSAANGISVFDGGDNCTIDGCTIFNCKCVETGGAGIYAYSVSNITITDNTIYSNGTDTGDHGVYIKTCDTGTVSGNVCHDNVGHGIQVQDQSVNIVVDKNYCYDNGYYGIFVGILDESNGCSVTNNLCYSNTNTGIYIGTSAPDILVLFNTCVNNGASGVGNGMAIGEHGCTVKNNLIMQDASVTGNARPLRIQDDDVLAGGASFDNNLYWYPNDSDFDKVVVRTSSAMGYTFTEWKARAEAPDPNGVSADPNFKTDYSNLHLDTGSAAIGEGIAISGYTTDYDGVTRGDPPDIGALEYIA